MLQIRASQLTQLGELAFERYLDRLVAIVQSEPFRKDVVLQIPNSESEPAVRLFVSKLVARAVMLGIECEGDVTPFCLLAICSDPEFRQSGIYAWITAVIQATDFTGEERMDAIYSLLPKSVRDKVFQYREMKNGRHNDDSFLRGW